jgi:hypothetical protein
MGSIVHPQQNVRKRLAYFRESDIGSLSRLVYLVTG